VLCRRESTRIAEQNADPCGPIAPRDGRLTPDEIPARYAKHKGCQQQISYDGGAASSLSQLCGDPSGAIRLTLFHLSTS
jgi:hypothetical protein